MAYLHKRYKKAFIAYIVRAVEKQRKEIFKNKGKKYKKLLKKDIKPLEFYIDLLDNRIVQVIRVKGSRVTYRDVCGQETTNTLLEFFRTLFSKCPKILSALYSKKS